MTHYIFESADGGESPPGEDGRHDNTDDAALSCLTRGRLIALSGETSLSGSDRNCWRSLSKPLATGLLLVAVEVTAVMFDMERRLAIAALLAQPDRPELRRAHRLRLAGKPERFALVPQLSAVFVQAKLLALHERRTETNDVHTRSNVGVHVSQRTALKIVHRAV